MQTTYRQPGAPANDPHVYVDDGGPDPATPARTSDRNRWPASKLADVELRWTAGPLDGLKLAGFALWEARSGNRLNVTMPARVYSVNGERRSFALVRTVDPAANAPHARIRALVLDAWQAHQDAAEQRPAQQTPAMLASFATLPGTAPAVLTGQTVREALSQDDDPARAPQPAERPQGLMQTMTPVVCTNTLRGLLAPADDASPE